MCKGCTTSYKSSENAYYWGYFDTEGERPFKISLSGEKHKVTVTSSNTSVVSVKSTLTGSKKNEVYLNAKKCGTATVTVKASCGNVFKIKVTVKDHKSKEVEDYDEDTDDCSFYNLCTRCGKTEFLRKKTLIDPDWHPTEDEIYQKMMKIGGDDHTVYGHENWKCENWTNWMIKQVWGASTTGTHQVRTYGKPVKDFSKARSGDIVFMPNHVAMVVKNHHDGYLELASNAVGEYDIGMSEEESAEAIETMQITGCDIYSNEVASYDCIDSIYTLYND